MALVFVIHDPAEQSFVERRLLRPLPALGFDRWISSAALDAGRGGRLTPAAAATKSAAIVAVVSSAASLSTHRERVAQARKTSTPVIVVAVEPVATTDDRVWSTLPLVPASQGDEGLWHDLAAVLPLSTSSKRETAGSAIPWDAAVFSAFLGLAIGRHDYHRGDALVSALTRHLKTSQAAYPDDAAGTDLNELRRKRQFSLMSRYAEAVIASGVKDFPVRRLYAQSLIELADFAHSLKVLKKIVGEAPPTHEESYEARGLIGRVYKQQYINAPTDPQAALWLTRAIDAYYSVYKGDPEQVWHGVNAASLMLRAARDGHRQGDSATAEAIATQVVATLATRQQALQEEKKTLPAFDCASRVEALVDLGKFPEARAALDVYLAHPSMHAFEVSSTYRQFDEVLQLHDSPEGRDIVDRLWQAVECHRAGGLTPPPSEPALPGARAAGGADQDEKRHMLLRVSDPAWQPSSVPDLTVHVRMGTVLSISGTEATVKSLLKDSMVVGVEDSGRAAQTDCDHSIPFIGVKAQYTAFGGTFSETGDAALVAIVDEGIDVLHRAFQDAAGQSRMLGIWDQRDPAGPAPSASGFGSEFNFGTFHDHATIQRWIDENPDPGAATFTIPKALTRNIKGHGTHVASIAAGRKAGRFAGGVAPDARMLIIIAATGQNIPYSMAHLAALKFIGEFATKAKLPVVVNLSAGMNAGAHDGRSALEVGFDEFSGGGRTPGRIVVKSAGNERANRGHAKVHLLPDGGETLTWESFTDPLWNRDRVELWWDSINTLRFRLTSPGGAPSDWVDMTTPVVKGRLDGGGPFRMELLRRHPDNADSRLVVELGGGTFVPLAAGTWKLDIEALAVRTAAEVHAWLEKGGTKPSMFVDHADEQMTLSVPGTAFSVITVGAVGSSTPLKNVETSSFGPTRDQRQTQKPDVVAPGLEVQAAQGGTFDDVCVMSGTSMAAPHVTGAIALLLSRAAKTPGQVVPSASQAGATLRQNTRNSTGAYTPNMGFGVINVEAFLAGA